MSVKSDWWIKRMALRHGMIDPFAEEQITDLGISYGLSSYGYDFRIAKQFRRLVLPATSDGGIMDPTNIEPSLFLESEEDICVIPPGAFVLARSLEYFRIPREVLALCIGKSTYARCGVIVNVTPLEPEWEGFLTVSISNTAPIPVRIMANAGIGQLVFFQTDGACRLSYRDRKGKYQGQQSITLSKGNVST
ncbi:MAG: dCTP deaminase [Acidobacteria bacterium]|nr:dCTP deaminase [Acidobacteriota bacterium]MBI3658775.1 dCTP deaminase [Acidobacteriota bacterium]